MDVNSPDFLDNPYKYYKERREAGRIIQIQKDVYSVGGYKLLDTFLSSPSLGRAESLDEMNEELRRVFEANPIMMIMKNWMLLNNPPDHTRIRKLVQKAFTPRQIREMEPVMRTQITDLISAIKDSGQRSFDMVTSISYPFPISIISEMMGIPHEDQHLFRKWSNDFAIALAMDITALPDTLRQRLNASAKELIKYFENLIESKRSQEGEDLVSILMAAEEDDDTLTIAEILSNCTLLLVAGHETTSSLISNGINLLLDHPDQLEYLRQHPDMVENAVEEFLRYDPPVQSTGRMVLEDVDIGGYSFKKGQMISMIIGGAGRDPEANPDPETFNIQRKEINHISFAKGIHYCLGAGLARMEAKIAFETILKEFDQLERDGPAIRNPNWLLRGFKHLPVKF